MFFLSLLSVCLAVVFQFEIHEVNGNECGTVEVNAGVPGREETIYEWPFVAALYSLEHSKYFCGGTLISNKHILTAAQCIQAKDSTQTLHPDKILVRIGAYNLATANEVGSLHKEVTQIHIHPEWNAQRERTHIDQANLAILVLNENVTFTNYIQQVCVPAYDASILGANGFIVGWVLGETGARPHREILRQDETTLSSNECRFRHHRGDTGGGFYVLHGSSWVQHAIITAIRTDNKTSTAAYTDLKSFKNWINGTVSRSGGAVGEAKMKIDLNCDTEYRSDEDSDDNRSDDGSADNKRSDDDDKMIYECSLVGVNVISGNADLAASIVDYANSTATAHKDIIENVIFDGKFMYLPDGVGNAFPNLKIMKIDTDPELKLIKRSNFQNLPNLKEIEISENTIETLDEDTFWDLPNLKIFKLIENKLKAISEKMFERNLKLRDVTLSSNQFTSLPRNLFQQNVLLKTVSFDYNLVQTVDENLFRNNTKLTIVDFSSNQLQTLPKKLFKSNILLEVVNFANNSLTIINEKTFEKNSKLTNVDLSSNRLEVIPETLFRNNILLEIVNFGNNFLTTIYEQTFANNAKLSEIYLSSNQLLSLPKYLFENNFLLKEFNFSGNSLTTIDDKTFKNNTKLATIDLSSNQLEYIPRYLFKHNIKMTKAYFGNNAIKTINHKTFEKNTELEYVDLSANRLQVIPADLFKQNTDLLEINLGANFLTTMDNQTICVIRSRIIK